MRVPLIQLLWVMGLSACVSASPPTVRETALDSQLPAAHLAGPLPAASTSVLQGQATLFEAPFAGAEVMVYGLPDLNPITPAVNTAATGWFQVALPDAAPPFVMVLAEKDGVQLSGVWMRDGLGIQAQSEFSVTLTMTLVTRLLLPRLLQAVHSQSPAATSQVRLLQLVRGLDEVQMEVAAVLAAPLADVRVKSTLETARSMLTQPLVRKLAHQVVAQTPAWQAYARWLQACHHTIIANVQDGGAVPVLEPWVVSDVTVESPQISWVNDGQATVHYQGQSWVVNGRLESADLRARLLRLDQLLGNPLPVDAGGSGGRSSGADAAAAEVTVLDGQVPAPVWEEP